MQEQQYCYDTQNSIEENIVNLKRKITSSQEISIQLLLEKMHDMIKGFNLLMFQTNF